MTALMLPMSFGEAADRIAILEIKRERIVDLAKRANVEAELGLVLASFPDHKRQRAGFAQLFADLKAINLRLWDIEDAIRELERRQEFGSEFVRLARAVYMTNDERFSTKRKIDTLFDSPIREEKSYGGLSAEQQPS